MTENTEIQPTDDIGHQDIIVRGMALRHAVRWSTWPGCRAATVTDTARIFEGYLRTGEPWTGIDDDTEHG